MKIGKKDMPNVVEEKLRELVPFDNYIEITLENMQTSRALEILLIFQLSLFKQGGI